MVLYDFLMIVKASAPKQHVADILRRTGARVLDAHGVITDITSFGTRPLAYEFTTPGEKHYEVRHASDFTTIPTPGSLPFTISFAYHNHRCRSVDPETLGHSRPSRRPCERSTAKLRLFPFYGFVSQKEH
jgi:ribosomal protein S6